MSIENNNIETSEKTDITPNADIKKSDKVEMTPVLGKKSLSKEAKRANRNLMVRRGINTFLRYFVLILVGAIMIYPLT